MADATVSKFDGLRPFLCLRRFNGYAVSMPAAFLLVAQNFASLYYPDVLFPPFRNKPVKCRQQSG